MRPLLGTCLMLGWAMSPALKYLAVWAFLAIVVSAGILIVGFARIMAGKDQHD